MDEAERCIWTCAFATDGAAAPEDRARHADAAVSLFRDLPDRHPNAPVPAPETQASYANAVIERDEFNIWYRIAMQIQFGTRPDYHRPTDEECEKAWMQYCMGLDSYY